MTKELKIHEAYAYLRVHDTAAAIDFYTRALDAKEIFRLVEPSGRIGHAEVKIGPTVVMISDEYPEYGIQGPRTLGGTSVGIHLHVDDVDSLFAQAIAAGATPLGGLQNQFYGERSGKVRDPFGHEWLLGAQIEDVSHEEMQRRYTAMFES